MWTEEAKEQMRDYLDTTDWDTLGSPNEGDIDSVTDCITDYINFCVESTIPSKSI